MQACTLLKYLGNEVLTLVSWRTHRLQHIRTQIEYSYVTTLSCRMLSTRRLQAQFYGLPFRGELEGTDRALEK